MRGRERHEVMVSKTFLVNSEDKILIKENIIVPVGKL